MQDDYTHPTAIFAHGKESGPWGSKITRLAASARELGFRVTSIDYQGIDSPQARLEHLLSHNPQGTPLVLVGSSMGGYVSAMAAATLNPAALFLMAPALYMDGYPGDPAGCPYDTEVVHGWDDDIVPLASSLAFAKRRRARLHLVPDDHRLAASLDFIDAIFRDQLTRVRAAHSSANSVSAR
ncbi:alpha/beta fold hydrolase [uncultured Salinisphaera sp.]|uniref:alpha/beta fold hydrolase n=1 Tax=uncultured Salinisphaera sp. TaxID=359372 RepID=UPI0032B10BAB|tara:strand:- start:1541 stop:2086 length:546 start_codon:yes stop_codon:yes gene_type:complete